MTKEPIPLSLLSEAAMSRRSSIYVWMLENHDAFAAVVAKAGRPNWKALAEAFGTQGRTDTDDKPPSAEVTRQTWWKVRKTVKARQAKAKQSTASPLPAQQQQAAPPRRLTEPPNPTQPTVQPGRTDDIRAMLAGTGRKIPDPINE